MELFKILPNEFKLFGGNQEISGLSCDTRQNINDSVFFCLKGEHYNGEVFAQAAINEGARVIVSEDKLDLPNSITQIIVPNARIAMSEMASHFYGDPAQNMLKIAVTGTNGKTTTTYLLKEVLTRAGYNVGVIGTNGSFAGNVKINSNLTTPDPIELFSVISKMKEMGVDCLCYEASAHALNLDKIWALKSDISILTNITQDHLDYFKTMENYANAKAKLFESDLSKTGIINTDSPLAKEIFNKTKVPAIAIGSSDKANIILGEIKHVPGGQNFYVNFYDEIKGYFIKLSGHFNAYNALGVIAVGEVLGLDRDLVKSALKEAEPVPGRFNVIDKNGVKVVIDYAHTPDGIENALSGCRELAQETGGKVITVFGCGGNRDAAKRPIMGRTACSGSDKVIITSDNPRYEDPNKIILDIKWGINEYTNFSVEPDRAKAIAKAIKLAHPGDVVAILGKGCEDYLEVCGKKLPYSDYDEVSKL